MEKTIICRFFVEKIGNNITARSAMQECTPFQPNGVFFVKHLPSTGLSREFWVGANFQNNSVEDQANFSGTYWPKNAVIGIDRLRTAKEYIID